MSRDADGAEGASDESSRRPREEFDDELRVLGSRLRAVRLERGVTQVELAKSAGVQQRAISQIESGLLDFRIVTLMRLVTALDGGLEDVIPATAPD